MKKVICLFAIVLIGAACGKKHEEKSMQEKMIGYWSEESFIFSEKKIASGCNEEEKMMWEITLNEDGTFFDNFYKESINFTEEARGVYFIDDNLLVTIYTIGISEGDYYELDSIEYYYRIAMVNDSILKLFNLGDNDSSTGGTNNIKNVEEAKAIPASEYLYFSTLKKIND